MPLRSTGDKMKNIGKIIFTILICFIGLFSVKADTDKNIVNIYLFHSDKCPHCQEEKKLLKELEKEYDNVRIYKYEVYTDDNGKLFEESAKIMETKARGVPFTIIGEKTYTGFSYESSKKTFVEAINYYSKYGYQDKIGEYLGNIELPKYEIKEDNPSYEEYVKSGEDYQVSTIFGSINTKNLALPLVSIIIGLVDGFNPCAMWVLLFLISMLLGMKDKRKMWILGISFLLTSAIIYLLFMVAWLNVASMLTTIKWIRITIGCVAIIGSFINIRAYIKERKTNGCSVVNEKKRNKIFAKIKKFTSEKNLFLALLGVITLAASVNIVELACSAGLPVMFIEILSMNNLTIIEEIIYIALYMIFFLLDDLIVFIVAMKTMELTGFSTKYGKVSKILGGILLLLIGILLIFKPEWIMLNFN